MANAATDTINAVASRSFGQRSEVRGRTSEDSRFHLRRLSFSGTCGLPRAILVKIEQVQAQAVLHFALAQIVQARLPMPVLGQIFCDVRRQKNVPGIAAVQHPLRNIDP